MKTARMKLAIGPAATTAARCQSGLPWSGGYRGFKDAWTRVDYVPLWAEGPAAAAGGSLTIQPGRP